MKVRINTDRCQGHGRCYDLVPDLFAEDEDGYSTVIGDGLVPADLVEDARLAEANCPEHAVELDGD
ncbi:MAG TPA: ferredoxin [Pseudonocardiaceae bacterium]|jgi:ferredoxin|nr:ferredoxin [Pseudonocardiaceae bacterium]